MDLEQTYWRSFLRQASLYDGVIDFLYTLRAHDIPVAVVTDLTTQIQFRKLIYFDIDSLIDHVITSEEAGADKPDPAIFHLAMQKLGVPPEATWMIGDDLERDIYAAEQIKMTGLLMNVKGSLSPNARHVVKSFAELIEIFNNHG